jgi:hypothetical protein
MFAVGREAIAGYGAFPKSCLPRATPDYGSEADFGAPFNGMFAIPHHNKIPVCPMVGA